MISQRSGIGALRGLHPSVRADVLGAAFPDHMVFPERRILLEDASLHGNPSARAMHATRMRDNGLAHVQQQPGLAGSRARAGAGAGVARSCLPLTEGCCCSRSLTFTFSSKSGLSSDKVFCLPLLPRSCSGDIRDTHNNTVRTSPTHKWMTVGRVVTAYSC